MGLIVAHHRTSNCADKSIDQQGDSGCSIETHDPSKYQKFNHKEHHSQHKIKGSVAHFARAVLDHQSSAVAVDCIAFCWDGG